MEIGMIGLGRMGANMVRRLLNAHHRCVVYDRSTSAVQTLVNDGAVGVSSLNDLIEKLSTPRAIWLMIPAALVDSTLGELSGIVSANDIIIDGGNSYYIDDIRRSKELKVKGIHYVDVGTSGGVWGLERGNCQMIVEKKKSLSISTPSLRHWLPAGRQLRLHPDDLTTARPRKVICTAELPGPDTS
jgi:6-phosphogluconate dehydrogenase